MTMRVIAIDGPAASGKSSTAAAVARALGFVHLDSGALYRAVTWLAVEHGVTDADAMVRLAHDAGVHLTGTDGELVVHIAGIGDAESAIRLPVVDAHVSAVAVLAPVRQWVNRQIHAAIARLPGAVIDGRDIGTVVVPDAALKVYLTAEPATRAERRLRQIGDVDPAHLAAETAELLRRDDQDTRRAVAPLRQADDAIVVDTTTLDFAEQVATIVMLARGRGLA
jgi:cytidylate kinase